MAPCPQLSAFVKLPTEFYIHQADRLSDRELNEVGRVLAGVLFLTNPDAAFVRRASGCSQPLQ